MRRTATLSLFAEEKENNLANVDHLFSINKKCKIQLGIVNTVPNYTYDIIDSKTDFKTFQTINYKQLYGDIVWFPLGVYVMFNPSIAHSMQGVTISMQLKDKMCLLNGDVGGQIHSAVQFSSQDQMVDADVTSIQKNPVLIYNIIKELVNHWGDEQLNKIIISEVPLQIKSVVKWYGNQSVWFVEKPGDYRIYTTLQEAAAAAFIDENTSYPMTQYQSGRDIGFIYTDFVYPGELICNAGQTVASVLDKIIGVMGNYEYFYDVEGNFIFREKQNYLNMTNTAYWTKQQAQNKKVGNLPTDVYEADTYRLSKPVYNFIHNEYTTAYNNTLNYNNIKNDFVVWGSCPATSDKYKIPCRFHLAIDKKPQLSEHTIALYEDSFQVTRAVGVSEDGRPAVDTELFPNAESKIARGRVKAIVTRTSIDWRQQIYYQMCDSEKLGTDENTELNNAYFQYYPQLKEEFPKIFNLNIWEEKVAQLEKEKEKLSFDLQKLQEIEEKNRTKEQKSEIKLLNKMIEQKQKEIEDFSAARSGEQAAGYKVDMEKHPNEIGYYLDFIDENSQLGQYSVSNIGRRAKVIDSSNEGINCVFEPQIPDIIYINKRDYTSEEEMLTIQNNLSNMGQKWTQVSDQLSSFFKQGGTLNSCFEKIKDLLYQYTHVNNTISITTLPIYYLEPNTRITVEDAPAGIYGDYIIQSISLPLDISSTMTVNAYKALQKI